MALHWSHSIDDIDWDELSALYRAAPLGDKKPDWLKGVFAHSMPFTVVPSAATVHDWIEAHQRSRAAILRLGANQEGIVRNERTMPNGRKRNSVRFSIINDEWPDVRLYLESRLQAHAT